MKSKKSLCVITIIGFISIFAVSLFFYKNTAVSKKIIKDCNEHQQNNLEILISNYTSFDWDTLIIYKTPVSKKELFDVTGLDYKKELDLKSGMIFTKDNQIVYDESFETDFESPYKFIIYPYEDVNAESNINMFSHNTAIFIVERIKYNKDYRYILKPVK